MLLVPGEISFSLSDKNKQISKKHIKNAIVNICIIFKTVMVRGHTSQGASNNSNLCLSWHNFK